MYVVVINDKHTSVHIEVLEHVKDYILTGKPWECLAGFDTREEARQAIEYLIEGEVIKCRLEDVRMVL